MNANMLALSTGRKRRTRRGARVEQERAYLDMVLRRAQLAQAIRQIIRDDGWYDGPALHLHGELHQFADSIREGLFYTVREAVTKKLQDARGRIIRECPLYWQRPADGEWPERYWAILTEREIDAETMWQEGAMRLAIVSPHRPGKYEWCWERLGKTLVRAMTTDEKRRADAKGMIDRQSIEEAYGYRAPMQWPESAIYH